MSFLLQHVRSRAITVTVGIVAGICGLSFCSFGILIGVAPLRGTETRSFNLLGTTFFLVFGAPALLYACRLLFPRLRPAHGGVIGPLGLEIAGVCLLILPVVLVITRQWGHLLLQLIHVGASTTCFALAHVRRRAAREAHSTGPAPIHPE